MFIENNKLQLRNYFFTHPSKKLRVRELARATSLPLPSITRYTKELVQEGILQKLTIGKTVFFTANNPNKEYTRQKILSNIQNIHSSGLLDELITTSHNSPIRLFGSYAKGEDTEESDIDIYIQTPEKLSINTKLYEQKLFREIHIFSEKNIQDIKNTELINNIMNGIPLHGYIELL
jgi:predicted nucleotidyltransferase